MRFITFLLCFLMLGTAAADGMPSVCLPLPACMVRAAADDAAEAAAILGADESALRTELAANGADCLAVSPDGSLWQLNLAQSSVPGLDFDTIGKKKAAIFAQRLSRSSGLTAAVVRLASSQEEPQPTLAPDTHRSKLWIRMTSDSTAYPREETWLTAIRGWEITVLCTWASADDESALSEPLRQTLYDLTLTLPNI